MTGKDVQSEEVMGFDTKIQPLWPCPLTHITKHYVGDTEGEKAVMDRQTNQK